MSKHQTFVTRMMIVRALMHLTYMDRGEAWDFSGDLDMSIEQDYLPEANHQRRYRMILKDCLEYVKSSGYPRKSTNC